MFKKIFLFLCIIISYSFSIYSAGADLTISSSISWAPGNYDYGTLTINNNSVLTLQGNTTSNSGVIINADNIIVESGSKINGDGQGFLSPSTYSNGLGVGGGKGSPFGARGGGAGHGGYGGRDTIKSGSGGLPYGSLPSPTMLGSSGGEYQANSGTGGGAIKLNVSGTVTINGTISVDATDATEYCSGGGSGGSVWIVADIITGSGSITSDGGLGHKQNSCGGGGSGGRIALHYNTNSFSGTLTAYGGDGGYQDGAAGTIYLKDNSGPNFNLIIDNSNSGLNGANSAETYFDVVSSDWTVDNLTIKNYGRLSNFNNLVSTYINLSNNGYLTGNGNIISDVVDSSGFIISTSGSITINNFINSQAGPSYSLSSGGLSASSGSVNLPSIEPYDSLTLNDFDFAISDTLDVLNTITVTNSDLVTGNINSNDIDFVSGTITSLNVSVSNLLHIKSGATFRHPITNLNGLQITAGTVDIDSGGSINLGGYGYQSPSAYSNGLGDGAGKGSPFGARGGGAGHGGYGGRDTIKAGSGGLPYGSLSSPTMLGSSGGEYQANSGTGGGAIKLNVSGTVTINGTISVDATDATEYCSGGGSGGSVWIIADTILGSGLITSDGGLGHKTNGCGGGGSGGRIALNYNTNSFSGTLTAYGGDGGYQDGAAGTIYLKDNSVPNFGLIIDNYNSGLNGANSAETYFDVVSSDWTVVNLTIKNYARLSNFNNLIADYINLSNNGYLTGNGNIISDVVDSSGFITSISGSITINDFINSQAGPSYSFSLGGLSASLGSINLPSIGPYDSLTLNDFDFAISDTLEVSNTITVTNSDLVTGNVNTNDIDFISGTITSLNVSVSNLLHIKSGATFRHPIANLNGLQITAGTVDIDSGGSINLGGYGYQSPSAYSNGLGDGAGKGSPFGARGGGAGHGGYGGRDTTKAGSGGISYGLVDAPTMLGSSGGEYQSNSGSGGGAVKINATNSIIVDGIINTDATDATNYCSGGGSGGSIWLITDVLTGTGSITSDGGSGHTQNNCGGRGAGGRIALSCTDFTYTGSLSVSLGSAGYQDGSDGTLYQTPLCGGVPAFVSPTPLDNVKVSSMDFLIINITDSGKIISGCKVNVDGVNHTMTYLNGFCNYTHSLNSSSLIREINFKGYYESSSLWYPIEERNFKLFPSNENNKNIFPSLGVGSFIMLLIILFLFI